MFLGFGGYFYYDGAYGYKNKNVDYYRYAAKSEVLRAFDLAEIESSNSSSDDASFTSPAHTIDSWREYVATHNVRLFKEKDNDKSDLVTETEGCFPDGFVFPQKIPQVFVEKYDALKKDKEAVHTIWAVYVAEQGLNESAGKYFRSRGVIQEQFYWAIGSAVFGCIALFFLLRTLLRKMQITHEGFTPAGGKLIGFDQIFKIDKRKWKRKGLAYVYYKIGDSEKKARVDGMVYGQFDSEDPHNAEHLIERLESSVLDAEVIEYEEDFESDDERESDDEVVSESPAE